ncbi:MAG: DNA polymerase IV [Treponema sp.]|nr:DNA polymerase IV [Treponema sp.]
MTNTWYLLADLDAFFASCEMLDHPEYRGKPVIVGGLPDDPRSVVSTASYEARKYGVHSAMSTKIAKRLCPDGIYVRGNMKRYSELSNQVMNIYREFSPDVEQMSIDEAFIDLTGTEKLFGPPEETALKIKAKVLEETGLTVSCGLSRQKYYAKIAAGLSKPDGFYFVKPGTEQELMLRLPLKDVWGIGDKTQAVLKNHHLQTTKDIFDKPLDYLEYVVGKNTASYLYNILRGNAEGTFTSKTVTHSISEETTFPVDITNTEIAKDMLLNLCQSVYFRLLASKETSKTVFIKIRYEDFETVSMRTTLYSNIATLDQFFETVSRLFDSKYERGRGIRLLGAGLDNVTKEGEIIEQSLFEDENLKKKAVEKAILNYSQKHPGVKIQKARTLIKPKDFCLAAVFALSLFLSFLNPAKVFAKENTSEIKAAGTLNSTIEEEDEEENTIFDINLKDDNVHFSFEGYWKAVFDAGVYSLFPRNGKTLVKPDPFLFKQEVDLDFSMELFKKWYVNASFADNFKENTIAFGYHNGEIVKNAMISNRNIVFPNTYSMEKLGISAGGGKNQAPGAIVNLLGQRFFADAMIRYDMVLEKQALFYGKKRINETKIQFSAFEEGRFFTLPDETYFSRIQDIFIEEAEGDFKASDGKNYRKLTPGTWLFDANQKIIILPSSEKILRTGDGKTLSPVKNILVSFSKENASDALTLLNFLLDADARIQDIQGSPFSEFSSKKADYEKTIDGKPALLLRSDSELSPFEICSVFNGGSETFEAEQSGYTAEKVYFIREDFSPARNDYFSEKEYLFSARTDLQKDFSSAKNRFPFFKDIYTNFDKSENDEALLIRTVTESPLYSIGTKASRNSIKVYINGFPLSSKDFSFSESTGVITINKSVSDSDRVFITWNEDSTSYDGGSLATAAGFGFNFTENLTGDTSFTGAFPFSKNGSFESDSKNITGSFGFTYTKDNLILYTANGYENKGKENSFQNKNGVQWKKEGDLIPYFIKNPDTSLDTHLKVYDQNLVFESTAKEKAVVFFADTQSDVHFTTGESLFVDRASYSVKTAEPLFKVISLEESYTHNGTESAKTNRAGLNFNGIKFPFLAEGKTVFENSGSSISQKNTANVKIGKDWENLGIIFSADTLLGQSVKNQIQLRNFGENYVFAGRGQISKGQEDASLRENSLKGSLETKLFIVKPKVTFSSKETYRNQGITSKDHLTSMDFSLPFDLGKQKISLSWNKSLSQKDSLLPGGDYKSDIEDHWDFLSKSTWFFKTAPIYDSFSEEINAFTKDSKMTSSMYTSLYSASWNRKLFNSLPDFFVPCRANLSFERDVKYTGTVSDYYQIKGTVQNQYFNLFGKDSVKPLFTWYSQDEGSTSFSHTFGFPRNGSSFIYQLSALSQNLFYITKTSSLKTAAEYSIDTNSSWKTAFTFMHQHNSNGKMTASLVKIFYPYFLKEGELLVTQLWSLNGKLNVNTSGENKDFLCQTYTLTHESKARIKKIFTLGSTQAVEASVVKNRFALDVKASLEGKIEF